MLHVLRVGIVFSVLAFAAGTGWAQSTNKVSIDSPTVVAGQRGVVTISVSNDLPMTLLNFDLTFSTSFCGDLVTDSVECVAADDPSDCCTGAGTGDCGTKLERLPDRVRLGKYVPDNDDCTGDTTPEECCSAPGEGTCTKWERCVAESICYVTDVSPQEGGDRCPTEGRMSFIFLDGGFTGNPIIPKCTCQGDTNKDGARNILDYVAVNLQIPFKPSPDEGTADGNCDGSVNILDYVSVNQGIPFPCPAAAGGGAIAQWVFDVRDDATTGAVPVTVTVNDSANGPVTVCETGGSIDPPTACTTAIGEVDGSVTINAAP